MKAKFYFATLSFFALLIQACSSTEDMPTKELNIENSILEFNINNQSLLIKAAIDEQTGEITKRLPEFINLKDLNIDLKFSENATISPDPRIIKDYSLPVKFTVRSESGLVKNYQVKFEHMDIDRVRSCSEANAWKWFGGDDRTNAPDILPYDRNVGTGQTIMLEKDLVPSVFNVELGQGFNEGFGYYSTRTPYNKPVTLKLIIRDENSNVIKTTTAIVSADFTGGLIPFDLSKLALLLEANKKYYFFWYLVDGDSLGIYIASPGNTDKSGTGFCFNSGWSGESNISKNNSLDQLDTWYTHPWHFNIKLEGKE